MGKKLKRWTASEMEVIKEEVEKNPENLIEAFKTAASKLRGRTYSAVSYKWYNDIKHSDKVFSLHTDKKSVNNTKNTKKIQGLHIVSFDKVETTYHNVSFKVGDKVLKADTLTL